MPRRASPTLPRHPTHYLAKSQQYFFRNVRLQHLRLEQTVRFFSTASGLNREEETLEDTIEVDDAAVGCNLHHRHYDRFCENTLPGTKFPSRAQGLEVLQRRRQARLGVCRLPFLEPLGSKREPFFEQRLMPRPVLFLAVCVGTGSRECSDRAPFC